MRTDPNLKDIFRSYIITFLYIKETSRDRLKVKLLTGRIKWTLSFTASLFSTDATSLIFANIHS